MDETFATLAIVELSAGAPKPKDPSMRVVDAESARVPWRPIDYPGTTP
jgi:hypothetical protein